MRSAPIYQPPVDNSLLASCHRIHGYAANASLWVAGSGIGVGCVWFLCVAFRAGVLTW